MSRADKDGTGTLDLIEFLGMMRDKIREENKESEINEAFKVFDTVRISWHCCSICRDISARLKQVYSSVIFKCLQKSNHCQCHLQDGNGYIDRKELGHMMRFIGEPVSQQEIDDILDEADKDANGLIDYREFAEMMTPGRN